MDIVTFFQSAFLGIVEGLTEFIPVSSTGHLILLIDLLGFKAPEGKVFEVIIQLGAILAVCVVYFQRLWGIAVSFPTQKPARLFVRNIVIAFLPAAILGALGHSFIKAVLFSPYVVCTSLVLGGIAILWIERLSIKVDCTSVESIPIRTALGIGLCQSLAMIPGVSRSGATIMGAILLGVDRKTATEFSFFLAIPTMAGAVAYDAYKNLYVLEAPENMLPVAIGFIAAFLSALIVVRTLLRFVSANGFTPFAIYRIILGMGMALLLFLR